MECSICMDSIWNASNSEEDTNFTVTKCGHLYHYKCLIRWLHKDMSCPICRKFVFSFQLQKVYLDGIRERAIKSKEGESEELESLKASNEMLRAQVLSLQESQLHDKQKIEDLRADLEALRVRKNAQINSITNNLQAEQKEKARLVSELDSLKSDEVKNAKNTKDEDMDKECNEVVTPGRLFFGCLVIVLIVKVFRA